LSHPAFILLFIGAPKQEILAASIAKSIDANCLILPLGGIFEELIAPSSQAILPLYVRLKLFASSLRLEWLFRFLSNPLRMWKRIFVSTIIFAVLSIASFLWLPVKAFLRSLLL